MKRLTPSRAAHLAGTVVLTVVVSIAAGLFAHLFRESMHWAADLLSGHDQQIVAADALPVLVVFVLVAVGVWAAATIGDVVERRAHKRTGLVALSRAATEDGEPPSVRATAARVGATWITTASLSSVGREAPILEAGGMLGVVAGRAARRPHHRLAVTGICAAFAVAYHAPFAALLYVEEHLRIRHDRRAALHAVAGAAIGFAFTTVVWGSDRIFPRGFDPLEGRVLALAAAALVPAYAASAVFSWARDRLRSRRPSPQAALVWKIGLVVTAAAVVALWPRTSGNGMEALRLAAVAPTAGLGAVLLFAKLAATSATIGTGAPGGLMSPSLSVAAGAALLTLAGLSELGVSITDAQRWDVMIALMAVGVAVSVQSPLTAVVLVPELTGDARLLPVAASAVLVALSIESARVRRRALARAAHPALEHDEDA
ncbi:MAG: chloride channel protein [Acidimicrobiales bacterium]